MLWWWSSWNRHQTAGYPPLLAGPRRPNNLAELICDHFSFISPAEKTRGKTGASQLDVGCTAPVGASLLLLYILGKLGGFIIQHVLALLLCNVLQASKLALIHLIFVLLTVYPQFNPPSSFFPGYYCYRSAHLNSEHCFSSHPWAAAQTSQWRLKISIHAQSCYHTDPKSVKILRQTFYISLYFIWLKYVICFWDCLCFLELLTHNLHLSIVWKAH